MEYQKTMLSLHLRANPKEVLVGWYATSSELNTFSALIQNFYGGQGDGTWPHPAVHLTVSTEAGKQIEARTYISAPVGVTAERAADSAAFIPVPYEIKYGDADKSGLELISGAKNNENRSTMVLTDIESLERNIEEVLLMLDRVSTYVDAVINEETPPSSALGQFLLNTLALAPKVNVEDIERDLYVQGVPLPVPWTNDPQQQPHSRRPGYLISCQYNSHTDRTVQSVSDSSIDAWRGWVRRIGWAEWRETRGWEQRRRRARRAARRPRWSRRPRRPWRQQGERRARVMGEGEKILHGWRLALANEEAAHHNSQDSERYLRSLC